MKRRRIAHRSLPPPDRPGGVPREIRWCERYGYFIDLEACRARARSNRRCGKCVRQWRQLPLPFMEDIP